MRARSERRLIHSCHYGSSADIWRIERSDHMVAMIPGSFPLWWRGIVVTTPTGKERGNDRLTSGPGGPVYDIHEPEVETRLKSVCSVHVFWKMRTCDRCR